MMSWIEDEGRIEASMGGHVTAPELKVLSEELQELIAEVERKPSVVLLDYSRIQPLDETAAAELASLKDQCLESGVGKIVSVTRDDEETAREIDVRLQFVLEGKEFIVAQGDEAARIAAGAEIYELEEYRKAA